MRGLDDYYGDDSDAFAGVEELNDRIAELEAENERLRGRIEAARGKHRYDEIEHMCQICMWEWPCPTVRALDGESND